MNYVKSLILTNDEESNGIVVNVVGSSHQDDDLV